MKNVHYLVALDLGNNSTKFKIKNQETGEVIKDKQPSAITNSSYAPNYDMSYEESFNNLFQRIEFATLSKTIKPGKYLIGKGAIDSGKTCEVMVPGENKVNSNVPYGMALGIISSVVAKQYPLEKVKAIVDMSIALPVGQITDEDARKYENNFMDNNTHKVNLVIGDKEQEVEIDFNFVRATPEGATSCFGLIYNEKGDVRKKSPLVKVLKDIMKSIDQEMPQDDDGLLEAMLQMRALHIDIGDGTTELPVTEGTTNVKEHSDGINAGVGYVLDDALRPFLKAAMIPDAPRQFLSDILENPVKYRRYHGKLLGIVESLKTDQVQRIKQAVIQRLQSTRNDIDVVIAYGGGSILFKDPLEKTLEEILDPRDIPLIYVDEKDAVWFGVEGQFVFLMSPVFKSLKDKYLSNKKKEQIV